LSFLALALVSAEDDARDCRSGLSPQVVQPAPPSAGGAAAATAGNDNARYATTSTAAARTRAVIRGRPATAATIARLPDRGSAEG
jgi:hypothetical protein